MKELCFIPIHSISKAQTPPLCSLGNKRAEKCMEMEDSQDADTENIHNTKCPNIHSDSIFSPQYMKGCREPKQVGSRNKILLTIYLTRANGFNLICK